MSDQARTSFFDQEKGCHMFKCTQLHIKCLKRLKPNEIGDSALPFLELSGTLESQKHTLCIFCTFIEKFHIQKDTFHVSAQAPSFHHSFFSGANDQATEEKKHFAHHATFTLFESSTKRRFVPFQEPNTLPEIVPCVFGSYIQTLA